MCSPAVAQLRSAAYTRGRSTFRAGPKTPSFQSLACARSLTQGKPVAVTGRLAVEVPPKSVTDEIDGPVVLVGHSRPGGRATPGSAPGSVSARPARGGRLIA